MGVRLQTSLNNGLNNGLRQSISGGVDALGLFKSASLDLRFASKKTLNDRVNGSNLITFARASSGTFVGADGLIKTTPVNFMPRSEQLNQWNQYFGASVTANSTTAPNGTLTADKLDLSAGNIAQVTRNISGLTPSKTYTFSFYAKSVTGTGTILLYRPTPTFSFTLTTEWQRFTGTITQPASSTNNSLNFLYSNGRLTEFFVWGVQFEEGSVATDYIPTKNSISGAPRFDHDPVTGESLGLLLEEDRTNKNTYSLFDDWSTNNISKKSTNNLAPDGTNTALMIGDSTGTDTSSYLKKVINVVGSGKHVLTFYAKGTTTNQSAFVDYYDGGANRGRGGISLDDGSTTNNLLENGDAVITSTDAGNGWWRCQLTVTPAGNTLYQWRVGNNNSGDIYVWGAQLEPGSFPTSYIPTSGSTVTRAADVAEITGTNFSSFYNQTEGTIFSDATGSGTKAYQFDNGTGDERIGNNVHVTDSGVFIIDNGIKTDLAANTETPPFTYKRAVGLIAGSYRTATNGVLAASQVGNAMPAVNGVGLGCRTSAIGGGQQLNGHIKRLAYFPVRLPDATLQSLTS